MLHPNQVIAGLPQNIEEVLLFHSGTGKDSIMLLDILTKKYKTVHCVFMYLVKGLEYENKYINWAEKKYKNCIFYQTPHYALYTFIKHGYKGIKKDPTVRKLTIKDIDERYRKIINVEYSVYGFKKIDGITRRFMLNETINGINRKTNKVYPLLDMKNKDVLKYINENNLIPPFNYGTSKPSSGCDISTIDYLLYIRDKYPKDLIKITNQFPMISNDLAKYDMYGKD